MRFLISIAVWVVFVGGLFLYTGWRDAKVVSGTEVKTAAAASATGARMAGGRRRSRCWMYRVKPPTIVSQIRAVRVNRMVVLQNQVIRLKVED